MCRGEKVSGVWTSLSFVRSLYNYFCHLCAQFSNTMSASRRETVHNHSISSLSMTAGFSPTFVWPSDETTGALWGQIRREGPEGWRRWSHWTCFTVLDWWFCWKAVWGIREREMIIMEMSKLSFWKIKQATDCFYITFTHWHTGLLFKHTHTHKFFFLLVSLLPLLSLLCQSALSLTCHLLCSASDTH